ncbi:MAG: C25 family cysteine peptidase [Spirosomataceae bacterium]
MKTKVYVPLFLIFLQSVAVVWSAFSQVKPKYGNEWINYNQQYYKLQVTQKGIYRVSFNDFKAAGIPTDIDPTTLQLYRRGREVAIFVQGEADKKFDAADYLEFYGEESNGEADSTIYKPVAAQPNKYVNVYTDSAAFFLTWRLDGKAGKRMAAYQQENTTQLAPEPYHYAEILKYYLNGYSQGNVYPLGVNSGPVYSYYDFGEGWSDIVYNRSNSIEHSLQLTNAYKEGGAPTLEWQFNGYSITPHRLELNIGNSAATKRKLTNAEFEFRGDYSFNTTLAWADVGSNGNLYLQATAANSPYTEEFSQRYIKLTYPQQWVFDQSSKYFRTVAKATSSAYIEVKNVPSSATIYDLTDWYEPTRVSYTLKGDVAQLMLQNTKSSRTLLIDNNPKKVMAIKRVGFRNITPSKHNFLVVSHPTLMQPVGAVSNAVKEYAGYRATSAGGKYDTLTINILDLYNQFSFGDKSTLAITRFADFMMQDTREKFIFLIGEPADPPQSRYFPAVFAKDIIPTGGYPASDWAMVMGINNQPSFVPGVSIGRLRAQSPQHILDYLGKVKEHEAAPNALWRKNFLHLGGGKTVGELNAFKSYLSDFKQIADRGFIGGRFTTITKKTDEPVEYINVTGQVNQGVGVMTFFGHSAIGVADIDVGYVSDERLGYKNAGKYPVIFLNGCDAGNIYNGYRTFGTDWLLTPNKGAILFLAHTYSGYPLPLKGYTDMLYKNAFTDTTLAGKPIGNILIKTIKDFLATNAGYYEITHAQQITLQGDPAIAVFPNAKPDYQVDKTSLFLTTIDKSQLVASTDSFRLGVVISNLGRTYNKPFSLSLKRTLNDGSVITFPKIAIQPVSYQDTIYVTIKNTGISAAGNNRFDVVLDEENAIAEVSETNNQASLDYLIPGYIATPLFPAEYSIINTQENNLPVVTLLAQAVSLVAGDRKNYLMEMDTTATFTSTFKRSQTIASTFLPTWKTTLLGKDSTVYYWRVRDADRPVGNENQWASSSFTFIKNVPEGWSQSQFPQFNKATLDQLVYQNNRWNFAEQKVNIAVQSAGPAARADSYLQNYVYLNNLLLVTNGNCKNNVLNMVAFNRQTLLPYSVNSAYLCGNPPFSMNNLPDDGIVKDSLFAKYLAKVPKGDYVLLFTSGTISWDKWPPAMKQLLRQLGADSANVAALKSSFPYILLGQKGATKAIKEVFPDLNPNAFLYPVSQTLNLTNFDLVDRVPDGSVTSSLIGPAKSWQKVTWQVKKDKPQSQTDSLDVWGVSLQGFETLLFSGITKTTLDLSTIKASEYPYLRLRWRTSDRTESRASQLNRWMVTYEGVPEGLIDFSTKKSLQITDKAEGEPFTLSLLFKNISGRAFSDSITVRQTLINRDSRRQEVKNLRVKALTSGDSVRIAMPIATTGWGGSNSLNVFFNPRLLPEQTYLNNAFEANYNVVPDRMNPILEVTFDGAQIKDGDVVSANPTIVVRLKDENKYLIRKDTTGVDLYLQRPCQSCTADRIRYRNNTQMSWASYPDNDFRVTYKPVDLSDGTYKFQVQGSDLAGNLAGAVPYTVTFKVVNQQSIRSAIAAPNPFSFFTKFSYSVTGSAAPDEFNLTIYNLLGEVVRTFTQQDVPLRVGTMDILWDGNNQAGLPLPNGMYLYKWSLKRNGANLATEAGVVNSGKIWMAK